MGNQTKTWHVIPAVVATAIMSFCGVLIETAMNVTFPTLMTEFNTDSSGIQWVTTGYLLAIAIVVPITAYLTRNYTIRQLFLAANLLFNGSAIPVPIPCIKRPSNKINKFGEIQSIKTPPINKRFAAKKSWRIV